ncbi:MAG: rod shape-determining protein MreC [Paludibacter sp.]|nr:rod shape-determining protein MreC [Paludibacter sp.]
MRNLFNFLLKYFSVLFFLILEIISFSLIISSQSYQRAHFFSSSNTVVASIYQTGNSVVEFFKLKTSNENLSEENTQLKNEIIALKRQLSAFEMQKSDSSELRLAPETAYRYISAKVINCSTSKMQNYITLNKGMRDGVRKNMGVISEEGAVGIVIDVSDKFSVVIPIINTKLLISSKFKRNNYSGTLTWSGVNSRFASLNDIARHVEFSKGDTLITSGFTPSFPENIPIGFVDDFHIDPSDSYYTIKISLAVDFKTLAHVKIIDYSNFDEQTTLEKSVQN